ncbi:MAG: branched-chain amino acid ABC transporter permease [Chitinophagaceae bacterium]|nr:branched-chain amino acid ABC transporter permease [Rubrivivax sp.]
MDQFLPFIAVGLGIGAVYALSGVGLVALYRASGVVNFAYGALGGLGAMVCWEITDAGHPEWLGWLAAVATATLLSYLYGRFVAPSLTHQDRIVRAVATLGFALMIMGLAQWYWGDAPRRLTLPTDGSGLEFNGRRVINDTRLLALGVALCMTVGMSLLLSRTRLGLSMRALQSDRTLGGLLGVRVARVDAWAWAIAGLFAGISGLFLASMIKLNPTVLTFLVIPALAAAIVGRLTSLWATVAGGLVIGVLEGLAAMHPVTAQLGTSSAFIVAITVILWLQRQGIGLSRDNSHLQ